ncbi:hypothetical protein JCM21900_005228 [Sporobolomyces salmonicolor]
MAHQPRVSHLSGASQSRVSLASDAPSVANTSGTNQADGTVGQDALLGGKYAISTVLHDPSAASSLLPALPSLSSNSYLPTQISSLGTAFTSAGTLPRSATSAKSVAQRRSQAPPIIVSELRKVARSEFDAYLAEVGPEFERWQQESRLGREGAADLGAEREREQGREGAVVGLGINAEGGSSAGKAKPKEEQLPSLDDVPQIFFDSDFNLSNPRTFDLVTERIQMSPNASPNLSHASEFTTKPPHNGPAFEPIAGLGPLTLNDLATDQILQEKLSHYTAVIESHLVREIGLRSSSFFAALSNLQSLHQQGEDTLSKISELQNALSSTDSGVGGTAKHGLRILRAQARRRGLERIEESVRAVEEIWTAVEGVKDLVDNGEWEGALDVSEQIEEAFHSSAADDSRASISTSKDGQQTSTSRPALALAASSYSSPTPAKPRWPRNSSVNLTKLTALSSLPSKLSLLRAQIAKSLEGELISVLEHEMDVGIEDYIRLSREGRPWKGKGRAEKETAAEVVAAGTGGQGRGEEDEQAPETRAKERAVERVRPVVRALVRAEGMDSAVQAWRESVLREVRAMVREHLPTAETPTADDEDALVQAAVPSVIKQSVDLSSISAKSLSLAKRLRTMPHEVFLNLARQTYLGLLACIEVVDVQARVLLELSSRSREEERLRRAKRRRPNVNGNDLKPSSPPTQTSLAVPGSFDDQSHTITSLAIATSDSPSTTDDASSLSTEISDVVHAVAELANVRFSKVIGVRTEVHAHLQLAQFVDIFDASWAFVVQCEIICKRMIVGLRGAMVSQAKTFLQTFHQTQITDSARVVENEQWAAAEVPGRTQRAVGLIIEGAMSDPQHLLLGQRRDERGDAVSKREEEERAPAKQVDVEGRQFFAVSAVLTTIDVLLDYLRVVLNCPLLTTDAMSKVIEFMKAFNSRTCQVVLGAGAMRSAGLKNITAKHLALASQALSIMVALIPYIRECVRRHLNPKQAVMLTEFDKLKRDFQEHQNEIHAKLIAIMSDRLQVHSRTLETINWEDPPQKPGLPNAYMEALVKEHITLHKVLSRFLQTETVFAIMLQVFTALDARLTEEYGRIELRSEGAKERMLVDVRYLREKLGDLKGIEGTGPAKELAALVQAKPLPKSTAAAKPSPLPPHTSSFPSPSSSPASTLGPTPSVAAPADPSAAPAQSFFDASASASTVSLSLPDDPSTPRTSIDGPPASPGTPRSPAPLPPSPVPVPAPLPPAPASTGPAPYVSKKKTFAERLAERMGKKPAPPPAAAPEEPTPVIPQVVEPPSASEENKPPPTPEKEPKLEDVSRPAKPTLEELEELEKVVEKETAEDQKHQEEAAAAEHQEEAAAAEHQEEAAAAEHQQAIDKVLEDAPSEQVVEPVAEEPMDDTARTETESAEVAGVAPKEEEPAPQMEEPAPQMEEPAPQMEEPAPQMEEPAPQMEEPALQENKVSDAEEPLKVEETTSALPVPKEAHVEAEGEMRAVEGANEDAAAPDQVDSGEVNGPITPAPEVIDSPASLAPSTSAPAQPAEENAPELPTLDSLSHDPADIALPFSPTQPSKPISPAAAETTQSADSSETTTHSAPHSPSSTAAVELPRSSTERPAAGPPPPGTPSGPPPPLEKSPAVPAPPVPTHSPLSLPSRKKTLKERLAEAARRASTGNALVEATSQPLQATDAPSLPEATPEPAKEAEQAAATNGKDSAATQADSFEGAKDDSSTVRHPAAEAESDKLAASPEVAKAEPSLANEAGESEAGIEENGGEADAEQVEDEESAFL